MNTVYNTHTKHTCKNTVHKHAPTVHAVCKANSNKYCNTHKMHTPENAYTVDTC